MSTTDTDEEAIEAAVRSGAPFLVVRDAASRRHVRVLAGEGPLTIGRRAEAEVCVPWDAQVSRVHAELRRMAGEWTVADDGLSQNGTYVNEVRLSGRRRLSDGDDVRVGRTVLTFRDPAVKLEGFTPLPGELSSPGLFSDQQRAVLRELCRPYVQDGDRVVPANDRAIGAALGLPEHTVANELRAMAEALEVGDVPGPRLRRELARVALATGIVSYGDLT